MRTQKKGVSATKVSAPVLSTATVSRRRLVSGSQQRDGEQDENEYERVGVQQPEHDEENGQSKLARPSRAPRGRSTQLRTAAVATSMVSAYGRASWP